MVSSVKNFAIQLLCSMKTARRQPCKTYYSVLSNRSRPENVSVVDKSWLNVGGAVAIMVQKGRDRMKVGIACGGTGGHIFPGLAVASVLRQRGHEVTLWLSGRGVEQTSIEGWTGPVVRIRASGFPGRLSFQAVGVACRLVGACLEARSRMKRDRPDVLLAMGSYASVGPGVAAVSLGIPLVLHEGNAVPGCALTWLSRFATVVALGFEGTDAGLGRVRTVVTGFPVRPGLTDERLPPGRLESGVFTVLVMGGSQGAHALNTGASAAVCRARARHVNLQVIHLAGEADAGWVAEAYERAGVPHAVFGFLADMGGAYAAADLAIARAGAATCAELALCGVPALLVPLPWARRGHQLANARVMQAAGAVDVCEQKDLTEAWLADYLDACCLESAKLDGMREALTGLARGDGAARLASVVEEAASVLA